MPSPAGKHSLAYTTGSTTVTDPLNTQRTYNFTTILGVAKSTGQSQPGGSGCGAAASAASYDVNGNVASRTDFDGNTACYAYDLSRNLETARVEGLAPGKSCPSNLATYTPASGTVERKISTQWHTTYHLPVTVAEPNKLTTYSYDTSGNLLGKTEQPTTDATGASGLTPTVTGTPRTRTYTYVTPSQGLPGQVKTVDGPRTDVSDVTTYAYYTDTASDHAPGDLQSITNALSQATSYTHYDADGRPLTLTDPNGLVTTLSYTPRGWLASRSRSHGGLTATTQYAYDAAGQLTGVTLPDGSSVAYSYDDAHRLTRITDTLGNHLDYTLDAMGNRVHEDSYDAANNPLQTRGRGFDALNRLWKDIGALNQTTTYEYDANGNLTKVDGPLTNQNDVTQYSYDALNRVVSATDGLQGITRYGYDGLDQLVSVTDPRNLVTAYTINGLGDKTATSSPDTGSTTRTYDSAGNLKTRTDAKGQTATYTYDALNRVTRAAYTAVGATEQDTDYQYDQGANGIGRLTRVTDTDGGQPVADTSYSYDGLGRLQSVASTVGGMVYTTAYRHDAAGHLTGLTYPDGRQVDYTLDGAGRISAITTLQNGQTQPIVSAVTYLGMSPRVTGYTLGNGRSVTRQYDQDGALASYSLNGAAQTVGRDAASRITSISDSADPANDTQTYAYDPLDRLTDAQSSLTSRNYQYDANGNRTTYTIGTTTDQYAYAGGSNRLSSVTRGGQVRSLVQDAIGNTTADGSSQHVYDLRGRRTQTTVGGVITQYRYNGLGQRILKSVTSGPNAGLTFYHYDADGHLLAETDSLGHPVRDYFYLGDTPVAVGE
jgi:YD repeat-containing protein